MYSQHLVKVNVLAFYAGFRATGIKRRITPVSLHLENGKTYKISEIKRSYVQRLPAQTCVVFLVSTIENDQFELLYDVNRMIWLMNTTLSVSLFTAQTISETSP